MRNRLLVTTAAVAFASALIGSQLLEAQPVCRVCVGLADGQEGAASASGAPAEGGGTSAEQAAIEGTLAALGFSYVVTDDPASTACGVAVAYPDCGSCFSTPDISWVQAGNGYVQISDWGRDFQPNTWYSITEGASITVQVADPSHPITQGVPGSWTTRGFWRYGYDVVDYVGYVTAADPNLAIADGTNLALSARAEGAGRLAYVGWNVYGPDATAPDLVILRQAIEWAGQCRAQPVLVEVPTLSRTALVALALLIAAVGAALLISRR